MCVRYSINADTGEIEAVYRIRWWDHIPKEQWPLPIYHSNFFDHDALPVITNEDPGYAKLYNWGLLPSWASDIEARKKLYNARGEEILEKKSYADSFRKRRCLVLATGFFEHKHVPEGKKVNKIPHHIFLKSRKVFAFGGIWSSWKDRKTGVVLNTFAILTTVANPLMAEIHNSPENGKRMPLILSPEQENIWLSNDIKIEDLQSIIVPYDESDMDYRVISKKLTSRDRAINNSPEVLLPLSEG